MKNLRSAVRILAFCALPATCVGCARPTVEHYVFSTLPTAKAIDPSGRLPKSGRREYNSNNYLIPVGAITTPFVLREGNVFQGTADVWNVNKLCAHHAFNASSLSPIFQKDDGDYFLINVSSATPPGPILDPKSFAEFYPKFPRNFIGYLDYVVINRTKRHIIAADSRLLDSALEDIKNRNLRFEQGISQYGYCGLINSKETKYQITGIAVYDVAVRGGYAAGVVTRALKDQIDAALIKAFLSTEGSTRRIYAVYVRGV